ncbi:universal stress protein [Methylomicrobium lacus]|uniref:universal stress protein n=1 Tax=Methylomicrobium lacus TaxID=136992 RepID=UPI00045E6891|nr:universal stress protein [Methylomicrobium lacus]
MMPYRHILLTADFSEHGETIATRAKSLARVFQAKLSILHVLDDIPMPDTGYGTLIPVDTPSEYDLLEAERGKLIALGAELGVDPADLWLIWGVPQDEIVRLAEKIAADLIVVGSHGRHGLALLLGSTANGVLHHASCDLLAIRIPTINDI